MTIRSTFAALAVSLLSACGDDSAASTTSGTCDLRTTSGHYCEEVAGPTRELAGADQACAEAGGTWEFDPCPATSLIGSCAYNWGPVECDRHFYPPGPGYDPEHWCTMSTWDGVHGAWSLP